MNKQRVLIVVSAVGFLILIGMLVTLLVVITGTTKQLCRRLNELEKSLILYSTDIKRENAEHISALGSNLYENLGRRLSEEVLTYRSDTQKAINHQGETIRALQGSVREQTSQTGRIEQRFDTILAEQQKQHIGSIAQDSAFYDKLTEARSLFEKKDFTRAAHLYGEIATYQKDNLEAIFYAAYAEFLKNPLDMGSYKKILDSFDFLEKKAYTRSEMNEVRRFVESEKRAVR